VHEALNRVASGSTQQPAEEPKEPAVSIKRLVQPDYIVCLEDGKPFKSLKRHLRTVYTLVGGNGAIRQVQPTIGAGSGRKPAP